MLDQPSMPIQEPRATETPRADIDHLRTWAPNLNGIDLAAALRALGALVAASRVANIRAFQTWLRTHQPESALRELMQGPPDRARRIPWTIGPITARSGELDRLDWSRLDAASLAAAWLGAIGGAAAWEPQAKVTLEVDAGKLDLVSLDRLSRLLGPVGGPVGAVVSEPRLGTGAEFRWPMRIAVAPGEGAIELRDQLQGDIETNHPTFAQLVDFVDVHGPHERCEILVSPGTLAEAIRRLNRVANGIDGSCLIALGGLGGAASMTATDLQRAIEPSVDPWAVAVLEIDWAVRGSWFSELVRQLSHDLTLEHALRVTAERIGVDVPFVVADTGALAGMGVRAAAIRAIEALPAITGELVELPALPRDSFAFGPGRYERKWLIQALQDQGAFGFERTGATAATALNQIAEREELMVAARPTMAEPPEPPEAAAARTPRPREGPARPKVRARYLSGQVIRRRRGKPEEVVPGRLEPATRYLLDVRIGAPDPDWAHANVPVPPEVVPREGERNRLRLVFDPGGRARPQTGMIELAASGNSSSFRFRFRSSAEGRLQGRLMVVFRNRVLQTALVTIADQGLKIDVESVVRPGLAALSPRRAFDLAFVHNHAGGAGGGRSRVSTISGGWVGVPPQRIDGEVDAIRGFLTEAAKNAGVHTGLTSKPTVELLYKLARRGHRLRGMVVPQKDVRGLGDPDRTKYVQVVSANPSALFPIELFYDFPSPNTAAICPNAAAALAEGRCDPALYHGEAALDESISVVCPVGFWAMNRVIERYASPREVIKDLVGYDFGVRSEPVGKRDRLGKLTDSLFAWSSLVTDAEAKQVADALAGATNKKAGTVGTWTEWLKAIKADGPSLLVLLSHTDVDRASKETSLVIAKKEGCATGVFGRPYVRSQNLASGKIDSRPGPLVFLLGCDTARLWSEYQSFVVLFRENHASLVIGTVGSVAASHAPRVATKLINELAARTAPGAANHAEAFGDVLLSARRQLLKDGEVMALALTSYGDADWKFG